MIYTLTAAGNTNTITSNTVKLTQNLGGVLKINWQLLYDGGSITSAIIYHSTDNSTWTALWDLGTLHGSTTEKVFYSYNEFIYAAVSFTAGQNTTDNGLRLKFDVNAYGLPDWPNVQVCREADLAAIMPRMVDTSNGFQTSYPDQMRLAKTRMEQLLRGKNINPYNLFTDGATSNPTVEGLRYPGALLTLYYANLDSSVVKSEEWSNEQKWLMEEFDRTFEDACSSGLLFADAICGDGIPEKSDSTRQPYMLRR